MSAVWRGAHSRGREPTPGGGGTIDTRGTILPRRCGAFMIQRLNFDFPPLNIQHTTHHPMVTLPCVTELTARQLWYPGREGPRARARRESGAPAAIVHRREPARTRLSFTVSFVAVRFVIVNM